MKIIVPVLTLVMGIAIGYLVAPGKTDARLIDVIARTSPNTPAANVRHRQTLEQMNEQIRAHEQLLQQTTQAIARLSDGELIRTIIREEFRRTRLSENADSASASQEAANSSGEIASQTAVPTASQMTEEDYHDVKLYLDSRIKSGYWTTDNAEYMGALSVKMSHAQRSALQHQIAQAINDGELEIEDISMPLF